MDKFMISERLILKSKKMLVLLIMVIVASAFVIPENAYAAPVDTSSGIDAASMTDAEFRQYLVNEGFPESYITPLMSLHRDHPSWVFQAAVTGLDFESVITKESLPGINVVASSLPVSYRSKASGCYDPSTGLYISYDSGGWYTATPEVIRYYMDPRNFFDDYGIFQFMTHSFDSSTQTKEGLVKMVNTTFLRGAYPKVSGETTTFATYSDAIYQAGKISGVNPYVIASIIIVEQGANGGGACISGTEPGYENIFNFFNIEAYAWGGRSAVANGLIYAMGSGSYGRPWNTRYKSILGGGKFYYEEYVEPKQNTLYFKKFNVMNGLSGVATHQYMSNVQGAYLEAYRLQRAYEGMDTAITFVIPVYKNMKSSYSISGSGSGALGDSSSNGYINDYEGINVRSGAGTSYSVVMTLAGEYYVNVTGSKKGSDGYTWFRISYSDRVGYVREDLIKVKGWIKDEDSGWHYYKSNGTMLKNGWAEDSIGWMWMDSNGNVTKSKWIKANGDWYYLKANGYMASEEWAKDNLGWCWLDSDGKITKSQWIQYDGDWYYLKDNGYMAASEWTTDSKGTMWMNSEGKIVKSAWIYYSGYWYYMDDEGYMTKEAWAKDSNGWCWMGADGKIVSSKWIKYNGEWYYLKADGYMATSWQTIDGKNYYFHTSGGYMYSGGTYRIDGAYYTFASNGELQGELPDNGCDHVWDEGVVTTEPGCETDGVKTFTCKNCGRVRTEKITAIGHEWGEWTLTKEPTCVEKGIETRYCVHDQNHFEERDVEATGVHIWDGGVVTQKPTTTSKGIRTYTCTTCGETRTEEIPLAKYGWKIEGGEWHYYNDDGILVTNDWARDNTGWMWMDANGSISRDVWVMSEGEWYYLNSDGYKAVNTWTKDRKGWMWMDAEGRITKSYWLKDNGEWYYLKDNGYMAASEWTKDKIGWMYMASNGKISKSKWVKYNGYWYYLKDSGYMATGKYTVDGTTYEFDSSGKWIG